MFPAPPGTQSIRFRQPTNNAGKNGGSTAASRAASASEKLKSGAKIKIKDTLIREQLNRTSLPWVPGLSVAFRILILIRFCSAMYTSISDCDETYNYWEPTHYLVHGRGFQTWEYSPKFSIRSWFFILIHSAPAWLAKLIFPLDKRPGFFAIRILLAFFSSFAEAKLYRSIADHINLRAARYFLGMTMFSAGMWSAATAYLPSAFALHSITLAYSYALEPVKSSSQARCRTLFAIFFFAAAALVGWPFVGALAIPFVFEELSMFGDDEVMPASRPGWAFSRLIRLVSLSFTGLVPIILPLLFTDWLAYGKLVFVPLNILLYNVFPSQSNGGPNLYGTEPAHFYILNLLLNFNIVLPLALLSIPLLLATDCFSKSSGLRLGHKMRLANQSSTTKLLINRLLPVYFWLGVMSKQPHKEERFMYPIYTLISFNAAVTLSLTRGWMEDIFMRVTSSPYRAGRTTIFSNVTRTVITVAASISIARILALQYYYHAPLDLMFHFQYHELPLRAVQSYPADYQHLKLNSSLPILEAIEKAEHTFDLAPLKRDNLSLCLGKSWYRLPTQFLVPEPIRVDFVKSDFKGILPGKFEGSDGEKEEQTNDLKDILWKRKGTRREGGKFNSMNREEADRYVDLKSCEYFIETNYPHRLDDKKGREIDEDEWEAKKCVKVLDPVETKNVAVRTLWLPLSWWNEVEDISGDRAEGELKHSNGLQRFGEMCLYRQKKIKED
ncbi:Alg9-like mannosyltransferase family-domain-containing protein, partial [Phakopsora pachyrhizi]